MSHRLRPLLLLVIALASLAVAACGGGGDDDKATSSTDVNQLLKDTFSGGKNVKSGKVNLALKIDSSAAGAAAGPVSVTLAGPFETQGTGKLPKFKLDAALSGAGQNLKAGATSTGEKGFINFQGQEYAVSDQVFKQFKASYEEAQKKGSGNNKQSLATLGIDPQKWLKNAKNGGEAKVGDEDTIKITGDVDVSALLDDLDKALSQARSLGLQGSENLPSRLTPEQRKQFADSVKTLDVEIYTGKKDTILRRMVVNLGLAQAADTSKTAGGARPPADRRQRGSRYLGAVERQAVRRTRLPARRGRPGRRPRRLGFERLGQLRRELELGQRGDVQEVLGLRGQGGQRRRQGREVRRSP